MWTTDQLFPAAADIDIYGFLDIYAISASRSSVSTDAAICAEGVLLIDGDDDGETSSWPVAGLVSRWSLMQGFLKKLNSEHCLILTHLRFLALAASICIVYYTANVNLPWCSLGTQVNAYVHMYQLLQTGCIWSCIILIVFKMNIYTD